MSIRGERLTIDGETNLLAKTNCESCGNWVIHRNLPEFDLMFFPYCKTEYDRLFDVMSSDELNPNGTEKT